MTDYDTENLADQPLSQAGATGSSLSRTRPLLWGFVGALIALALFFVGLGVGFGLGRWRSDSHVSAALGPIPAVRAADARTQLTPAFETFWEAMNFLYRDFYGQLPTNDEATYGAIRGVIEQLDDPNTSFMTPQEAEFFRTSIRGHFEGIGAHVEWDDERDTVVVTEPFENQPAWNAGIRRGDLILAVDGESIVGTNLNDAVAMIRGPKDSTVMLTILRDGEGEPFDVEVVRDRIEPPTISTTTLGEEGEIAYVRLNTFNENAGQLVRQAVQDAVDRGATALVFDLRGNTGGLLREAVKVASVFLESDETVLIERFSDGREQIYRTEGKPVAPDLPLAVLVDGGSASASEIVAGALQDTGRAELIGTVTYGKGSVQLPHTLTDGSIMRVTIARWYTPDDRSIDGAGLKPDVTVEISDEELKADEDPQLDRALDILQK